MKIMVADDDPISRYKLKALLIKSGYDVVVAHDGYDAWKCFQGNETPNLAIIDWLMPGINGIEICKKIRKLPDGDYKYIILLTSKDAREDIIQGMESGADDYITKPFDPDELRVRLRAGRRIIDLQLNLIEARETLRVKAMYDCLTGLLNRQEIIEFLQLEFKKWKREKSPLCIIMADIDHFKKINDKYGHLAGDVVLRESAGRMVEIVRPYDRIGRFGGEEFIFVLPGCNLTQGKCIAERIRLSIANEPIDTPEGLINVTISLGVATTEEIQVSKSNDFIHAADIALYNAKKAGRNYTKTALKPELNSIFVR